MPRVVSGVAATHDGKILMGRRPSGKMRGDLWELPGGKVDANEEPRDALVREWWEELEVTIATRAFIATATLDLETSFVIDLYAVVLIGNIEPRAKDHAELRWVDPLEAVKFMPCSPAFYLHWPWLRRWLAG